VPSLDKQKFRVPIFHGGPFFLRDAHNHAEYDSELDEDGAAGNAKWLISPQSRPRWDRPECGRLRAAPRRIGRGTRAMGLRTGDGEAPTMSLLPLRRSTVVCTRHVEDWFRFFDHRTGCYRRAVRTVEPGETMPRNHPTVRKHNRHFRRGAR
jgi:hypothetical protein